MRTRVTNAAGPGLVLGLGLLALTACSGTPTAAPSSDTAAETSVPTEASVDTCTELSALAGTLTELNTNFDPNTLLESARTIDAGLQGLEPPAAVAAEWSAVASIFADAVSAADAAGSDRAAQEAALTDVLEAQATPEAVEQLDTIAAAIGDECGGGAAPKENESCALMGDAELATLFGGPAPAPAGTDFGSGFAECEWEASGTTVLVSILPAAEFTETYLNGVHEPVGSVEQGTALPDFVGIGRVSTHGGTVAQVTGDRAVLVAVQTPDESTDTALAAAETLAIAASARLAD